MIQATPSLSLENSFDVYHSFLAELKFLSHLLYLLVIALYYDLVQCSVIADNHFHLDLFLPGCLLPVIRPTVTFLGQCQ